MPFEILERRPGNIASSYADVSKAKQELGWTAQHSRYCDVQGCLAT
ncbi:MAG: hypothetical protein RR588_14365 [Solibacillus sp.]